MCCVPAGGEYAEGATQGREQLGRGCLEPRCGRGLGPLTCSASPGRKLSYLVPAALLKVIALHAADRLRRLATNHNHDLQKDKHTLTRSAQHARERMTNLWPIHALPASLQSYTQKDAALVTEGSYIFKERQPSTTDRPTLCKHALSG